MTRISHKASQFSESVIREMTRLALVHGAINLAQGFPDFDAPEIIREAACRAIMDGHNQYPITWGTLAFREAIAAKTAHHHPGWQVDPHAQVTVTCGATEGMIAAFLGLLDPDDEIIVFEPFYENYRPDAILAGVTSRTVTLHEPDWSIDPDELRAAFGPRTRGIVVNSPHNPTGKVFARSELELIAALCDEFDAIAFCDEIYEHIRYHGDHLPMALIPGMAERTVTINAMSKTYSVTGWRVGWVIASPELSVGVRRVHDFLTVAAAAPLQAAGVVALSLPDDYYAALGLEYRERRDLLIGALRAAGFGVSVPAGAYYVMTDISALTDQDDRTYAVRLMTEHGIAGVPGSSFFRHLELGRARIRFAFPKRLDTLRLAAERLAQIHPD